MHGVELGIRGPKLVVARTFGDARGYFRETYRANDTPWSTFGPFVQENESLSAVRGTVRGLHYQIGRHAQAKLVRAVTGAILDVVVDLRRGSPTFGAHEAVLLTATGGEQLFVPVGFGHGFCTLEADTIVSYKVSAPYDPAAERAVRWNDPALAIDWPVDPSVAVVSDKDAAAPLLADQQDLFDVQPEVVE